MPDALRDFLEGLDTEDAFEVQEWLQVNCRKAVNDMIGTIDKSRVTDETEVTY
jgi:hypothetical protein